MTDIIEVVDEASVVKPPSIKQKTAGFWMRFWAFLLDSIVISAIIGVSIKPVFALMNWSVCQRCVVCANDNSFGNYFLRLFCAHDKIFQANLRENDVWNKG